MIAGEAPESAKRRSELMEISLRCQVWSGKRVKPKSQHSSFRHHHLPPALGVSNGVLVDETVVDDGALNTRKDEKR